MHVFGGVLLPNVAPNSRAPAAVGPALRAAVGAVRRARRRRATSTPAAGSPTSATHEAARAIMLIELAWYAHRVVWHLIFGGVLERHPNLRIVLTEQGTSWIPRGIDTLDWFHRRMTHGGAAEAVFFGAVAKDMSLTPSEYFQRNFWVGASFLRPSESALRYEVGVDRIMWGADYPHSEGSYPYTTEALRAAFAPCPPAETRMMVETTAAARVRLRSRRAARDRRPDRADGRRRAGAARPGRLSRRLDVQRVRPRAGDQGLVAVPASARRWSTMHDSIRRASTRAATQPRGRGDNREDLVDRGHGRVGDRPRRDPRRAAAAARAVGAARAHPVRDRRHGHRHPGVRRGLVRRARPARQRRRRVRAVHADDHRAGDGRRPRDLRRAEEDRRRSRSTSTAITCTRGSTAWASRSPRCTGTLGRADRHPAEGQGRLLLQVQSVARRQGLRHRARARARAPARGGARRSRRSRARSRCTSRPSTRSSTSRSGASCRCSSREVDDDAARRGRRARARRLAPAVRAPALRRPLGPREEE